jgi:tripartite-type tricarboxylate transporter receptor subunit TctC
MCNFKKKGISTFSKSIFFILILLFSILISLSAQTIFPTKPVEIIVTFAAGGAVDTSTRVLASEAEKYFGQKILITNKTGGGGTEGIIQVSKAKPDGYQLLALTSAAITNIVTKKVDYQIDSFDPVIMFTYDPATLSVYANGDRKSVV